MTTRSASSPRTAAASPDPFVSDICADGFAIAARRQRLCKPGAAVSRDTATAEADKLLQAAHVIADPRPGAARRSAPGRHYLIDLSTILMVGQLGKGQVAAARGRK